MNNTNDINYFHRQEKKILTEKVYGDKLIKTLYQTPLAYPLALVTGNRIISQIYGKMQSTLSSGKKVPEFIKTYSIDLNEYKAGSIVADKKEHSYASFNEFFIREFEEGKRKFNDDSSLMAAPCEARYFGHEVLENNVSIPVKGVFLKPRDLLAGDDSFAFFENGPLLIARLCPVDYHRYHYPDEGATLKAFTIPGRFESVNPIALKAKPDIFMANERRVSILETKNFGRLAYIEVGAMCVGKIVQSFDESKTFKRGQEKGYFLFGGSTVVILGEPGKWQPSQDILSNTQKGIETYVKLGDVIAEKN